MKARDVDTLMSILGSLLTASLIVLKGLNLLVLSTSDCLTAGLVVASCTKLIAVSQVVKTVRTNMEASTTGGGK